MPRYTLTNRSDDFDSSDVSGWTDGSRVFGGNGDDTIRIDGDRTILAGENGEDSLVAYGDWNILLGGNGKDVLRAVGDENRLYGGNGVDRLIAVGEGNLLDGGNGADLLFSTSRGGFGAIGEGNVLTGGHAFDTFILNNRSDLHVINDEADDTNAPAPPPGSAGVVSEGDIIVGVMDEITDYSARERLRIGATEEADAPAALDSFAPSHRHLVLADGEYAFIRGDQIGNGRFEVNEEGGDLLLVYDASGGGDALFLHGAVVLQGVTDPDAVFIA